MMEGGNLLQLTNAALHPFFEIPDLSGLLIGVLILGIVFGPVILHITRHMNSRNVVKQELPPLKKGD